MLFLRYAFTNNYQLQFKISAKKLTGLRHTTCKL